jgi:hypothetical protein
MGFWVTVNLISSKEKYCYPRRTNKRKCYLYTVTLKPMCYLYNIHDKHVQCVQCFNSTKNFSFVALSICSLNLWFYKYLLFILAGEDITLHAGNHLFPFQFVLPINIPGSFEGKSSCYVRYWLKANIDRPWKFDPEYKMLFTVGSVLDLNTQANAMVCLYIYYYVYCTGKEWMISNLLYF